MNHVFGLRSVFAARSLARGGRSVGSVFSIGPRSLGGSVLAVGSLAWSSGF
jgi:hypothetical protein